MKSLAFISAERKPPKLSSVSNSLVSIADFNGSAILDTSGYIAVISVSHCISNGNTFALFAFSGVLYPLITAFSINRSFFFNSTRAQTLNRFRYGDDVLTT